MPAVRRPAVIEAEFTGPGLLLALERLDVLAAGSLLRPRTWAAKRLARLLAAYRAAGSHPGTDGVRIVRVTMLPHEADALAELLGVPPSA